MKFARVIESGDKQVLFFYDVLGENEFDDIDREKYDAKLVMMTFTDMSNTKIAVAMPVDLQDVLDRNILFDDNHMSQYDQIVDSMLKMAGAVDGTGVGLSAELEI